jgi:hypothetical protein
VALIDLAAAGAPGAADVIRAALADPDASVAAAAVRAFATLADGDVDTAIAARLSDPAAPAQLRIAAATALRDLGGAAAEQHATAIEELLGTAADSDLESQ